MSRTALPLDELVAIVESRASSDETRLAAAVALSSELDELRDELVDHYVRLARERGLSWVQIGQQLGVSRQAAHQRFGARRVRALDVGRRRRRRRGATCEPATKADLEMMTGGAKDALATAQDEARKLGHGYLGTEHLLLGVLADHNGVAAKAMRALDISADIVRRRIMEIVGRGRETPVGEIPLTPRSKKVLELSRAEAKRMKQNSVGTEHLLLALAAEGEGMAARTLVDSGVTMTRLRSVTLGLMSP